MPSKTYSDEDGPLDMKSIRQQIEVTLFGTIHVAKHAAMAMTKNKPVGEMKEKGVIIFMSSIGAYEALSGGVGYSATRGALNAMTMPMARDLGKYNIRVASIA